MAKLLFQTSWLAKVGWDDELGEDVARNWGAWKRQALLLPRLRVPRHLKPLQGEEEAEHYVAVFADASELAYAACVYVVGEAREKRSVQLAFAKTRVAPLHMSRNRKHTIPRLELQAAMLAVEAAEHCVKTLEEDMGRVRYFLDSLNILYWLKGSAPLQQFVANRVHKVLDSSKPEQWFYVPTGENPADLATRGLERELKLGQLCNSAQEGERSIWARFSRRRVAVAVAAWILRWKQCRAKPVTRVQERAGKWSTTG